MRRGRRPSIPRGSSSRAVLRYARETSPEARTLRFPLSPRRALPSLIPSSPHPRAAEMSPSPLHTVRLKPDTTTVTVRLKPDTTFAQLRFPAVIPSCTATPITPRISHAIGAHRSPVDCGYRIQTSVADDNLVMPFVDSAFVNPTIIVHAPPSAVPTMMT